MRAHGVTVAAAAIAVVLGGACGGPAGGPARPVSGPPLGVPDAPDPTARGAAYLAALAAVLEPRWRVFLEDCRQRLPATHPLNAAGLSATFELSIARDGAVIARAAIAASGNGDYDTAVADVLADAAPLPAPPAGLASDDDLVHVRWLFARDRRQAGAATAQVVTVERPLGEVVASFLVRGELARAAERVAAAGDRLAQTQVIMTAALAEAGASPDSAARRAAVAAIARAEVRSLAAQVRIALAPTVDVELQLAAIDAVAQLGDRDAVPALVGGLTADVAPDAGDTGPHARLAIARAKALVALGRGEAAATVLSAALSPTRVPPMARPSIVAIRALGIAPVPALAPQLSIWIARRDAPVRAAVCEALPRAAPDLAAALASRGLRDPDATVRAACSIKPLSPAMTAKLQALAARDPDDRVRDRAARALRPDEAALSPAWGSLDEAALAELAAASGPFAGEAFVQLVARKGRAATAGPLLARLAAAGPGSVERVRIAQAWLLAR